MDDVLLFLRSWGVSETAWFLATGLAYVGARRAQAALGHSTLANPVLLAGLPIGLMIWIADVDYATYDRAGFVWLLLLGPATVGLAVPFHRNWRKIRKESKAFLVAMTAGSIVGVGSAVAITWALGASPEVIASMAPKSVTTPIAIGISEQIDGLASLTAAFVIFTGIIGAMLGGPLMRALGVTLQEARGTAYGTAAGGIGTAQAFQEHELAGTFAGISVTVNGVLTALLLPVIWMIFQ